MWGFRKRTRRFATDTRGAVTVEFVIALPLMLTVLVFASQYGEAMQVRNALDVAVRDAARLIARAPLDNSGQVPAAFVTQAEALITDRLGDTVTSIDFRQMTGDSTSATVVVRANVSLPLLRLLTLIGGSSGDLTEIPMNAAQGWPRTQVEL